MVCRGGGGGGGGRQSLAGERLWHGSMRDKFVAIAQPDPVLALKIVRCVGACWNDLHAC